MNRVVIPFCMGLVLFDVFLSHKPSDLRLAMVLFLFFITAKYNYWSHEFLLKFIMGLLILLAVLFIFWRSNYITDRLALWIYLFMFMAVFLKLLQFVRSHKK